MSQRDRTINHCDICSHEWIPKQGVTYTHCTSGKCRSRKWNLVAIAKDQEPSLQPTQKTTTTLNVQPTMERGRPDMDALRAACAGELPVPPSEPSVSVMCTYTEYDGETGETYACGRFMHSSKIKHTRGAKV